MSEPAGDERAVTALAQAIDAALDTWDAAEGPAWATGDPDRRELAAAIFSLLSQHGYTVAPLAAASPSDPGYGLVMPVHDRVAAAASDEPSVHREGHDPGHRQRHGEAAPEEE